MKMGSIDWQQFQSLTSGNLAKALPDLLDIFQRTTPVRIQAIRAAIETCQVSDIRRETHALKSGTCFLGAVRLAEICDQIDALSRQGKFQELPQWIDALEEEHLNVISTLS